MMKYNTDEVTRPRLELHARLDVIVRSPQKSNSGIHGAYWQAENEDGSRIDG